jgi:hypothetical protein
MHDLDPRHIGWEPKRIGGSPAATYEIRVLSPLRPQDLIRQFHRKIRQMRGRLENLAIRSIVYNEGFEGLPEYADDMIKAYLSQHPLPRPPLPDRPFQILALRRIRASRLPDPVRLMPTLTARLDGRRASRGDVPADKSFHPAGIA